MHMRYSVIPTDSLLTALIALLGWVSFAVIMGVILFFIIKGFALCFKQKSGLGFWVSFSIMMTFTVQVVGYVAFNLGFQLVAPISLPLISFGNTATILNLVLIGIMLSVFRTGDVAVDGALLRFTRHKIFSWDDGKLTIEFKWS